jgi:hypothetical protein
MKLLLILPLIFSLTACVTTTKKPASDGSQANIRPVPMYYFYKGKREEVSTSLYGTIGGNGVSYIEEGEIELPPIKVNNNGRMGYIIGAGPDKTVIKGEIYVSGLGDLTIVNATWEDPSLTVDQVNTGVTFVNVKVKGKFKRRSDANSSSDLPPDVRFYLSEFDQKQEPVPIFYSVLIKDGKPETYPGSEPESKKGTFDPTNRLAQTHRDMIPGGPDGAQHFVYGKKEADIEKATYYRDLAREQRERGNYYVSNLYVDKAYAAIFNRASKSLADLKQKNTADFARQWTCGYDSFYKKGDDPLFNETVNSNILLRGLLYRHNKDNLKASRDDGRCVVRYQAREDYVLTEKAGPRILETNPMYAESARSKQARKEAEQQEAARRQALREAKWNEAMAGLEAASDRLVEQAKFNYENRNTIDQRATGTYLTINNRQFRYQGSSALKDAVEQRQKLEKQSYVEGGKEFVLTGYETRVAYTYKRYSRLDGDLVLQFDGKERTLPLPAISDRESAPCKELLYNGESRDMYFGDECKALVDKDEQDTRRTRIHEETKPSVDQFLAEVFDTFSRELARKAASSSPEDRLEAYYAAAEFNLPLNAALDRSALEQQLK